jgi:hypothetical protein
VKGSRAIDRGGEAVVVLAVDQVEVEAPTPPFRRSKVPVSLVERASNTEWLREPWRSGGGPAGGRGSGWGWSQAGAGQMGFARVGSWVVVSRRTHGSPWDEAGAAKGGWAGRERVTWAVLGGAKGSLGGFWQG